jgi:hypothetical protein
MRGFLLIDACTAHTFAIQRDGIIGVGVQSDAQPIR